MNYKPDLEDEPIYHSVVAALKESWGDRADAKTFDVIEIFKAHKGSWIQLMWKMMNLLKTSHCFGCKIALAQRVINIMESYQ